MLLMLSSCLLLTTGLLAVADRSLYIVTGVRMILSLPTRSKINKYLLVF